MDTHNYYYMQLVVDSDLDDIYTDMLVMERTGVRVNHGLCQVAAADGDAHMYGGIARGLVVTKAGAKSVYISAGTACDASGRKITLGSQATIPLTNIGQTPVGSLTGAATGVAIAISAGKEAWVSLYAQYGEVESDPRIDGDDDTVYFRVTESFRFFIAIGSEATAPATDRAGLSDSYVHLADILLEDDEEIASIDPGGGARDVICCSNADFDYFNGTGRDYSSMHGHRGDWIVIENATDFPLLVAAGKAFRKGTAREGIYELAKNMEAAIAATVGAANIGAAAESSAWDYPTSDTVPALVAGTIQSQLGTLIDLINQRVPRAGGTGAIIRPLASQNGLAFDTGQMTVGKAQIEMHAKLGSDQIWARLGLNRGHMQIPHLFWDDFMFAGDAAGALVPASVDHRGKWGTVVGDGSAVYLRDDAPGGVVRLTTNAVTTNAICVATGYNGSGSTSGGWWKAASTPFAIWQARFRIPSSSTKTLNGFGVGLVDYRSTGGGEAWENDVSAVLLAYDPGANKIQGWIKGYGSGAGDKYDLYSGSDIVVGRWYTVRCAITSDARAYFQLNDEVGGEDAEVTATLNTATLENHVYNGVMFCRTGESEAKSVDFDHFMAADGKLAGGL